MKRRALFFVVIVAVLAAAYVVRRLNHVPRIDRRSIRLERFGEVKTEVPEKVRGVALVFGDTRLSAGSDVQDGLHKLLAAGIAVFQLDARTYLDAISHDDEACSVIGGEIERLNQSIQGALGLDTFRPAALIGYGQGALIAFVSRFQSPDRFDGTLASGFCPSAPVPIAFCPTDELTQDPVRGFLVTAPNGLPGPLGDTFLVSPPPGCPAREIPAEIQREVTNFSDEIQDLIPRIVMDSHVSESYVIELPAEHPRALALFLSGDGGWADIDRSTGEYLRQRGIAVVGFNSLRYFWSGRSPAESAAEGERLIREYSARWQVRDVILVGFSLGANAVPFMYNRFSPEIQSAVRAVVLLSPERLSDLQVHISEWIVDLQVETGMPLLPEIELIPQEKVFCLSGAEDDPGVCDDLDPGRYHVVQLPGDHHFDGDFEMVGKLLEEFTSKRLRR